MKRLLKYAAVADLVVGLIITPALASSGSYVTIGSITANGNGNPACLSFTMQDTGSSVYYGTSLNDPGMMDAVLAIESSAMNLTSLFFTTGTPSGGWNTSLHPNDCGTGVTYIYRIQH